MVALLGRFSEALTRNFLFNLFCAVFNCLPQNNFPTDPTFMPRDGKFLAAENFNPVVDTKYGAVQGYTMRTVRQRPIFAFEGIPYGEYTGGRNRFKPPVPKLSWNGTVRSARNTGSVCLQLFSLFIREQVIGSEDCLFLNIYTPTLPEYPRTSEKESLLPVLVYIHGGAFTKGSGKNYGPAYFLDENVILVNFNYRLGVLGFLSTGDLASPGNYGLKDQALAIKWIHDNIINFGGDPSKITLIGQSAGGVSSHLHLMSNMTKNLANNAITLSGNAFNPWAIQPKPIFLDRTFRIAHRVGCNIYKETYALVRCLKQVNPFLLVAQQRWIRNAPGVPTVLFGPVVEPIHLEAFLTSSPEDYYARDEVAPVPFIATVTKNEGQIGTFLINAFGALNQFSRLWNDNAALILELTLTEEDPERVAKLITEHYIKNGSSDVQTIEDIGKLLTDRMFIEGLDESLKHHSKIAPTFSYIFGINGKFSAASLFSLDQEKWGPIHSDDLPYLFNSSIFQDAWRTTDPGYSVAAVLTNIFSNFAQLSIPVYTNSSTNETIELWKPIDPNKIEYLLIENPIRMIDDPFSKETSFWKSLNLTY